MSEVLFKAGPVRFDFVDGVYLGVITHESTWGDGSVHLRTEKREASGENRTAGK